MESAFSHITIPTTCSLCGKKCTSKRGCLIGQIQTELNLERHNTKYKPLSFIAVSQKLKHLSDEDIAYTYSICKDSKNRSKGFGKCLFGSLKSR